jgi:hypothetical protein
MKRLSLLGLGFGLVAIILAGCPIYSNDGQGSTQVCEGPGCNPGGGCTSTADCPANYTCGSDNQCDPGDCTNTGCSSGFVCVLDPSTDTASCQPGGIGGSGTGTTATTGTGASGSTGTSMGGMGGTGTGTTGTSTSTGTGGVPAPVYCGHPSDCTSGTFCATDGTCHNGMCQAVGDCIFGYQCMSGSCVSANPNACDKDSDCAAGSVCIAGPDGKGGTCTAAPNQCFDSGQCGKTGPNASCVAGKCAVSCMSDTDCIDGYTCNTTLGTCTNSAKSCNVTNDCGGPDEVCVGGTCVPRAPPNSTNCPNGGVWTENGCIPDQAPNFTCQTDGVQDSCAMSSICLHHDCWIQCDPTNNMCASQLGGMYPECKAITSTSGTYNVCGSETNLGGECGPGAPNNMTCANMSDICVDGFCK